jgi:hypothetical protein
MLLVQASHGRSLLDAPDAPLNTSKTYQYLQARMKLAVSKELMEWIMDDANRELLKI